MWVRQRGLCCPLAKTRSDRANTIRNKDPEPSDLFGHEECRLPPRTHKSPATETAWKAPVGLASGLAAQASRCAGAKWEHQDGLDGNRMSTQAS